MKNKQLLCWASEIWGLSVTDARATSTKTGMIIPPLSLGGAGRIRWIVLLRSYSTRLKHNEHSSLYFNSYYCSLEELTDLDPKENGSTCDSSPAEWLHLFPLVGQNGFEKLKVMLSKHFKVFGIWENMLIKNSTLTQKRLGILSQTKVENTGTFILTSQNIPSWNNENHLWCLNLV